MSVIEKRYAEALLDIAVKKRRVRSYVHMLNDALEIYNKDAETAIFFANPMINKIEKKKMINRIFTDILSDTLMRFMMVLVENTRIAYFPEITESFREAANRVENIVNIEIHSAFGLDMDQLDAISEMYREKYKARRVRYDLFIEPELIGGIKVKVGDKVYDDTVLNRLTRMQKALLNQ